MTLIQRMGVALAIVILTLLVVIPLFLIIITSVYPNQEIDLLAPLRTVMGTELSRVFWNTMLLGTSVVLLASVFAFPMAFLSAKTEIGRHKWLDVVLMIPFMTPPYIGSMGWILFMQRRGFLEQMLPFTEVFTPWFFSFFGMVLIMSLHLFPFLYLILRNVIRQIGGGLEEAGAVYGGGFGYRLRKIIMPLMLSSYAMGSLLIFVKTISEFGTPLTFGKRIGFEVLTGQIHRFISTWPIDFAKATALSSVLLTTCMLIWYVQSVLTQHYTYKTVGGKGVKSKQYKLSLWGKSMAWFYVGGLLATSIGVPYFSVISTSIINLRGSGLAFSNFTLKHYYNLLSYGSSGFDALMTSLGLSFFAASIAMILGTYFSIMVIRSMSWSGKLTDLFSLLPNTVPGIVIVVGLILFWNSTYMPVRLYNTYGMVVLTYVVLFLPYTVQNVKAVLGQIDNSLFNAGRVFGGNPFYVFRRILIPLILPGMIAGWMLTFTISVRELVASLIILPPSMQTSATFIFAQFEQGEVQLGMAMALISVGLTTVILIIMNRFNSDKRGHSA